MLYSNFPIRLQKPYFMIGFCKVRGCMCVSIGINNLVWVKDDRALTGCPVRCFPYDTFSKRFNRFSRCFMRSREIFVEN